MKPINEFNQYDEIEIINSKKRGIVLDFVYVEAQDMYNYFIDCEEEVKTCRANELKKI